MKRMYSASAKNSFLITTHTMQIKATPIPVFPNYWNKYSHKDYRLLLHPTNIRQQHKN